MFEDPMSKCSTTYGPLHAGAPTHDKITELAAALNLPQAYAFGLAAALWARALMEAPTGVFRGGAAQVARMCLWEGDPAAVCNAMVACGILDKTEDGRLAIHEWSLYGGASLSARSTRKANGGRGGRPPKVEEKPAGYGDVETGRLRDLETGRSPLLSSDLSDQDPDRIAETVPTEATEPSPQKPSKRPEPLGPYGEVMPESADGVLAFRYDGETLMARWRRDHQHLDEGRLRRCVEAMIARRDGLEGSLRRSWNWPRGFVARADGWLRDENIKAAKLKAEEARLRPRDGPGSADVKAMLTPPPKLKRYEVDT